MISDSYSNSWIIFSYVRLEDCPYWLFFVLFWNSAPSNMFSSYNVRTIWPCSAFYFVYCLVWWYKRDVAMWYAGYAGQKFILFYTAVGWHVLYCWLYRIWSLHSYLTKHITLRWTIVKTKSLVNTKIFVLSEFKIMPKCDIAFHR